MTGRGKQGKDISLGAKRKQDAMQTSPSISQHGGKNHGVSSIEAQPLIVLVKTESLRKGRHVSPDCPVDKSQKEKGKKKNEENAA